MGSEEKRESERRERVRDPKRRKKKREKEKEEPHRKNQRRLSAFETPSNHSNRPSLSALGEVTIFPIHPVEERGDRHGGKERTAAPQNMQQQRRKTEKKKRSHPWKARRERSSRPAGSATPRRRARLRRRPSRPDGSRATGCFFSCGVRERERGLEDREKKRGKKQRKKEKPFATLCLDT